MKAVILAVGDEVLLGDVVNTNAAYLAKQLDGIGIEILYHLTVGDDAALLRKAFVKAFESADIVLTCGGLGPTKDDLTKDSIAEAMGLTLLLNEEIKAHITALFASRGFALTENNFNQCMMPQGSVPLVNTNGTAPGVYIETGEKIVAMMPGPPSELIPMFENELKPKIITKVKKAFSEKYYMTSGYGESMLEQKMRETVPESDSYTVNTYITQSGVMVKATGRGADEAAARQEIERRDAVLKSVLGESLYSEVNEELWHWISRTLIDRNITLSAAESCTGGLFASYMTKSAGISSVFRGGIIAYDNEIKINVLGVSASTLQAHGAVSEQTAREMALCVREKFSTDIGVGITGIAGPGGATEDKPVGLVYICVNFKGESKVARNIYGGNREMVQRRSALSAMNILREFLR